MTHTEALNKVRTHLVDYEVPTDRDLTEFLRAYVEARGLVLLPRVATDEMRKAGESWSALPGQTWDDMLAAAPDPFEEGE